MGMKSADRVLRYLEKVSKGLGAVVISDYGKGMVSRDLLKGIRKILEKEKVFLCADPKVNDFSLYEGCHVITPNHHEAMRALGREGTGISLRWAGNCFENMTSGRSSSPGERKA